MADELLVARRGGVTVLTLNRPERVNALTGALHAALTQALTDAAADAGCGAILLHGAGRAFCAGQDLNEVGPGQDLGEALEHRYNPLVRQMRALPKPIVCAVHGVAAGAGATLALACDIILAGETAQFLQAFIRIGLIPDAGGTWALPRLAGSAKARGLAMLGEPIGAAQAEAWGLIWRTVPDDALMAEAERTAAQLAGLPTHALGLIKRALNASEHNTLDQQLDLERDLQREAGYRPDFQEGVRAFLEKRAPRFNAG